MSAMTENPTLMSDLAREQQRRRTMIGQVYRQGRDMHAANVKLNEKSKFGAGQTALKILEACHNIDRRAATAGVDRDELQADMEKMIETLWLYGVHSWCVGGAWRWFVAGMLNKSGELT